MKIIFSLIIAIAIKSVVDVKIKEQKELREINKRDELKEMTNRVAKEIEKNRRNKGRKVDEDNSTIKEKKGNCNWNKEEIIICNGNSCISQRIDLIDKKKLKEIIIVSTGNNTLSNSTHNNDTINTTSNDNSNNPDLTNTLNNNKPTIRSFPQQSNINQLLNNQNNNTNASKGILNSNPINPLFYQSDSNQQLSIPQKSSNSIISTNTPPMNLSNNVTIVNSQKANSNNNSKKLSLSSPYNNPTKTITNINIEIS